MNAPWLAAMEWRNALFVHWPVAPESLREKIPRDLELDVIGGSAWVGIIAFSIAGARTRGMPPSLALGTFGEVNVRTYVSGRGVAGVWFLSLDAAGSTAVRVGRRALHLPYLDARITTAWDATSCAYRSERIDERAPPARFDATAQFGRDTRIAAPASLEHGLVERYCFFTVDPRGRTLRGDVEHPPWPLRDATLALAGETLLGAAGITPGTDAPLAHASTGVSVRARMLVPI